MNQIHKLFVLVFIVSLLGVGYLCCNSINLSKVPDVSSWRELKELPSTRLSTSNSKQGSIEVQISLMGDGSRSNVRFRCTSGTNDYCHVTVNHEGKRVLRFAGNCDVYWGKPQIWLEPLKAGKPRRFLTYHRYLINDDIGESLDGGYWIWEWNGGEYRPRRP